jgi:uncharacterized protein (TIGR03437 family)
MTTMRTYVPAVARRLCRALALVFPLAALAGSSGAERVAYSPASRAAEYPLAAAPVWVQQQELTAPDAAPTDAFGDSVSVSGNTAVIGTISYTVPAPAFNGAAYVYVQSGGVWSLQQELTDPNVGQPGVENFGAAVSIDGDTLVVGAFGKNTLQGAVYIYTRSNGVWTQQAELTAPDGAAFDTFGIAVSLNGNTLAIGAPTHAGGGAVYVFTLSGGGWNLQEELNGSPNDGFGVSVAVSGTTLVVGADTQDVNANGQGAAYIFNQSSGAWYRQATLIAADGAANDYFGRSASVDGTTAVVGAVGNGAAYVYVLTNGAWNLQQELTPAGTGISVSVSGNTAVLSGGNAGGGAAYVFGRSGSVWTQQQELTASDEVAGDGFGGAVSVSGTTAAIGAAGKSFLHGALGEFQSQGAAYVFGLAQTGISGVIGAGAFGAFSAVAPGTWVEIYGSGLAPSALTWTLADFSGNNAPTTLGGVQVTVGGAPAFIDYVSPGQVNAQLPSGIGPGTLPLTVSSGNVVVATTNVTVNATEPGLLAPPSFKVGANQYVVAQLADGTYVLPAGAIAGINSRPAKPGEEIVIYGIGFGSVVPNIPAGEIASASNQISEPLQFLFGQTAPPSVPYAGLTQGSVGLYQFNIVVPQVPDNNLVPLTFTLGGVPGTQTLYTAVHQ